MKWGLRAFLWALVFVPVLASGVCREYAQLAPPPPWAYDSGPNPHTPEGQEIIDLLASLPHMPVVSRQVMGTQKFRPAFGSVPWRMTSDYPIKILVQGQDATHIAEAAGRTATASFGGRAQDLVRHFGVDESSAFWNAYQFTIRGQYGAHNSPYLYFKDGKPEVRFAPFVDNQLWSMTHEGPQKEWRDKFTELMLRQHPELKLWILFGGAARDTSADFVNGTEGGYVGTRISEREMKNILVPEMEIRPAGGNNEFAVPVGKEGQDLYGEFLGRKLDYSKPKDQEAARKALEENVDWFMTRMVFSRGGPYGNGLIHPGQLGGYDLRKMRVNGEPTMSLRGLTLSDGTVIDHDVLLAQLPHPSALSRMDKETASRQVGKAIAGFSPYVEGGWGIEPDPGQTSHFNEGAPYAYGRADIGPEFYDFGAPRSRMVSVSTASRMPRKPWGIIFGTRERAEFDETQIDRARHSIPSEPLDDKEIWSSPPRGPESRYDFDPGPGEKWARLMKENLPLTDIFQPKKGKTWKNDGIDAFNLKTHPDHGDFGHYRGTFNKPRVLILADPHGAEDLLTSRALSGSRGQYLHGLMNDTGVGDRYLVLKTVPFGMDGATPGEWNRVLEQTRNYRETLLREVLKENAPEVIVADGPQAKAELQRILGNDSRVVVIQRGQEADYGIRAAGNRIAGKLGVPPEQVTATRQDIPRNHLPPLTRYWLGRGGDHVFGSVDKTRGQAFAVVAPEFATEQQVRLDEAAQNLVNTQVDYLRDQGLRLPGESVPDFLARRGAERGAEEPQAAAGQ